MVLLILLLFHAFTSQAIAQVVINEVFPNPSGESSELTEFVELYNTSGTEQVDLGGYVLVDAKDNSYEIAEETFIDPIGFVFFTKADTGIGLNNGEETISLKNKLDEEVDSFTYSDTEEDKSWSRYPDGIGIFYSSTIPTMNFANASPPTSTPTLTPTPTKTPTPTNTAKPTSTLTPTPSLIPTKKVIPTPTENGTLADEYSGNNETNYDSGSEEKVLSVRQEINTSEDDDQVLDYEKDKTSFPVAALAIILGGVSFIVAGTFPHLKQRLKERGARKETKTDVKIKL